MDLININYDDFNTNLCEGLQSALASSEMSDVTLAVEGKYFKAHQLILSIFSTYFRELFHVTPSRNTTFLMKNVKHRIMHNLLVFMYEGKVQIPSEDVRLFVDTADELKIKGLTNDMVPNAAEISRGQVNNADNFEHGIDIVPSLIRASEPMKQKANKHKRNNNETDQSTSEASVLTLETNKHIREADNFIQVIQKIEEPDIGEMQSSDEETEENMNDVGPTKVQCLNDNTMTVGNDLLVAIDHDPLPPPFDGKPVTVSLCFSRTTNKLTGVIWDKFRYCFKYECTSYARWTCTGQNSRKCRAMLLWAAKDDLITLSQSHNHETRRILANKRELSRESRTLYAVSEEYFRQYVRGKWKTSNASKLTLETNKHLSETEEFSTYGNQLKEKYTDTIDVDPTEMNDLDDKTNVMDGDKEDNTTTMGNDLLVAIDHDPLPPPSEAIPVTISLCRSQITNKLRSVIWGNFRHSSFQRCKLYDRWLCTGHVRYKCKATLLWARRDGLITLSQSHNHDPTPFFKQTATTLESLTLNSVSSEYFKKTYGLRKT